MSIDERKRMERTLAEITERRLFEGARRMASRKYERVPNWVFAMEMYGLGSNYAHGLCQKLGIDPDATTAKARPMVDAFGDSMSW